MGYSNYWVEYDFQILVKAIHNNLSRQFHLEIILEEIREWMLKPHIMDFSFIF